MPKMKLKVVMDNDIFQTDEDCGPELARILRDCANRVENKPRRAIVSHVNMTVHDVNGNPVGKFQVVGE